MSNIEVKVREETAKITLITHSGLYHADDVFTYAVLGALFPTHNLLRTRDLEVIEATPDAIVFDVGSEYASAKNRFDHHQKGSPLREDGVPYSSFGLVWKHFGMEYLHKIAGSYELSDAQMEELHRSIDHFAYEIDALDNGHTEDASMLNPNHISRVITWSRPVSRDEGVLKDSFVKAADIASFLLMGKVTNKAKSISDEAIVRDCLAKNQAEDWIELPEGLSFNKVLSEPEHQGILYVITPEADGQRWCLIALRSPDGAFKNRKCLPKAWAGLRGEELQAVTKTEDAIFCHLGRFLALAESRESILKMLWEALND